MLDRNDRYSIAVQPALRWYSSISGFSGDCIAVRTQGVPGTPDDQERTLRSLALYGPGDARIGYKSDPVFWGQVQKIWHAIYVFDVGTPRERFDGGFPMIANVQKFGDAETPGEIIHFDDGEYVQALRTLGRTSLIWTSSDDVVNVVDSLVRTYGPQLEEGDGELVLVNADRDGNFLGEGDALEVCTFVQDRSREIGALAVQIGDLSFSWQRSSVRRPSPQGERTEDLPIVSESGAYLPVGYSPEVAARLVQATATPGIVAHVDLWWPRLDLLKPLG